MHSLVNRPLFIWIFCFSLIALPNRCYATGNETGSGAAGASSYSPDFATYISGVAAIATLYAVNEIKKVIGKKDFARNLGIKTAEAWKGFWGYFEREDKLASLLPDHLTGEMRRILAAAMTQGLKTTALDGVTRDTFVPGYFDTVKGYFAWQNLFPSTREPDEVAPGLVLYIPNDAADVLPESELHPLEDFEAITQAHLLTEQILDVILPPESERDPLLKNALKQLKPWFYEEGAIRSSVQLGRGEKIKDGVQVLRLVRPTIRHHENLNLLGTLLYFPDLNPDKINVRVPLLINSENKPNSDWKKGLPERLKWFLKMQPRYFSRGVYHASQQRFCGPIINEVPLQEWPAPAYQLRFEQERSLLMERQLCDQDLRQEEVVLDLRREYVDRLCSLRSELAVDPLQIHQRSERLAMSERAFLGRRREEQWRGTAATDGITYSRSAPVSPEPMYFADTGAADYDQSQPDDPMRSYRRALERLDREIEGSKRLLEDQQQSLSSRRVQSQTREHLPLSAGQRPSARIYLPPEAINYSEPESEDEEDEELPRPARLVRTQASLDLGRDYPVLRRHMSDPSEVSTSSSSSDDIVIDFDGAGGGRLVRVRSVPDDLGAEVLAS